ncbi:MAG: ATP-binding protein [Candidatus Dormibacteria bacterium]
MIGQIAAEHGRSASEPLLERHIQGRVEEALADTRVVLIAGPRQAGKSTLATLLLSDRESDHFSLDNLAYREAARNDPLGFVDRSTGTLFIDEVQRVPELAFAIKEVVDRDPRPGSYLLTGSTDIFTIPQFADALVGRLEVVTLYPFSQGEIDGRREGFIDRAFAGRVDLAAVSSLTRRDYIGRAVRGGYPEVVGRPPGRRRNAWFSSYVATVVQRDITSLAHLDRLADVPTLLRLAAARTASPLNIQALARDAGVAGNTARKWLALLQGLFVITLVPAWSNNRTSRAALAPKLFMVDSGLAAHLAGVGDASFGAPTMDPGWLLETFVAMELVRQATWSSTACSVMHFRTRDGLEVDCVLETPDRRVLGIEVKSSATVTRTDFRGLAALRTAARDNFAGGMVLYTGSRALSFGDGFSALPISSLWGGDPDARG